MIRESALAEWHSIATFLNDYIREHGQIQINNNELWREYLHRWDNQDWTEIIETVAELHKKYPEYFHKFHKDAIAAAITILIEHSDTKRVMDRKQHKKIAWKMIMTMRETWNAATGIDLPNEPIDKFGDLFE